MHPFTVDNNKFANLTYQSKQQLKNTTILSYTKYHLHIHMNSSAENLGYTKGTLVAVFKGNILYETGIISLVLEERLLFFLLRSFLFFSISC